MLRLRVSVMLRPPALLLRRLINTATQISPPPLLPLPMHDDEVTTIENLIGYKFHNPMWLEEALIHPSYPDRSWSLLSSCPLRRSYHQLRATAEPSLVSALKTHLSKNAQNPLSSQEMEALLDVNLLTQKLARNAVHLGLYPFVRRNSPQLDREVLNKILMPIITREDMERNMKLFDELSDACGSTFDVEVQKRKGDLYVHEVFVRGKLVGSGSSEEEAISKLIAATEVLWYLPDWPYSSIGNSDEQR